MSLEDLFVVSENIQALRAHIKYLEDKGMSLDSEALIREYIRYIDKFNNKF